MPEPSITFFVPGLFEPGKFFSQLPANDIPRFPALEYFLNRATEEQSDIVNPNAELAELFDLSDLPVGALTYHGFNTAPTGPDMAWYMCADPVYIQADRDDAVLLAHEELHLSTEEAQFIAADINHFYKNEPWELVVLSTRHWVIKSDIQYDLQLTSLQTVSGQRVRENLPQGKDAKYWRQVLNEIQMLLHGMPLHQQRELEGKLPVNSLWFWGAGSLPELNVFSPGKWQMVFGKDRLCEAISKYTNCPYNNIDNQVFNSDNMGFVKTKGDCLFLDQGFSSTVHTQEEFQKQLNMLLTFDAQWIKPAITLLKQGKLDSLRLLTGRGKSFHLRKENCNRKKWGWWYSNKLFQQFVE